MTAPPMAERRLQAAVFLLPILLLLPFVNKPLHIDDQLFVWTAQQIAVDPLDFYGLAVDYGYEEVPIHAVFHNPPAVSYLLALVGPWTGWAEWPMRLVMSLFAGLGALGIYLLARDLDAPPLAASLISVLSPAYLVSASTIMSDVPMLAVYVWALLAWRRGLTQGDGRWLWTAAIFAALAPLTKYFGLTLLPLMLVFALFQVKRPRRWWIYLLVPVAIFVLFQTYLRVRYETAGFFDAAGIALADKWRGGELVATRPVLTVVFIGATFLPLVLCLRSRRIRVLAGGAAGLAVFGVVPILEGYSLLRLVIGGSDPFTLSERLHFALFLWAGLSILLAWVGSLRRVNSRADAVLLVLWGVGTFAFTAWVNHYVSVRTILPMLPAVAIPLAIGTTWSVRHFVGLAAFACLTLWVTWGDYEVAAHDKAAAEFALEAAHEADADLYYTAFWGLEHYLMEGGATPIRFEETESLADRANPIMQPGDLLIVDSYALDAWTPTPPGFSLIDTYEAPYRSGMTTFDLHANAGLHSHTIGQLPYRFGVSPERYPLLRWEGPSTP